MSHLLNADDRETELAVVRNILSALDEFSNSEWQRRVWIGDGTPDQSSFVEAANSLFSDSTLSEWLDRGEMVFDHATDQLLVELLRLIRSIDPQIGHQRIVATPQWPSVMRLAKEARQRISEHFPETA